MFFLKKGVLGDNDIKRLLGKDIFIYPFSESNLKGSTYNLTASMCAFIVEEDDYKHKIKKLIINENNRIIIPKNRTALIQTNESIYVSNRICGTYHSRVKLVNKGLTHIGTTLDPCYFGTSVIAIHNNSDDCVEIKVGEPIVSLMFYTLRSRSNCLHDNLPFRKDLFDLEITDFSNETWGKNKCEKCVSCEDVKSCESKLNFFNEIPSKNECDKCQSCDKTKSCEHELGKKDIKKRNDILEKLDEWKKEEFRTNRNELIKQVKKYVAQRDKDKNINAINFIGFSVAFIVIMILLVIVWTKELTDSQIKVIISSVAFIVPLTLFLLSIIKDKKRGE
jgi:deoxycytidine triphosphate deaminase